MGDPFPYTIFSLLNRGTPYHGDPTTEWEGPNSGGHFNAEQVSDTGYVIMDNYQPETDWVRVPISLLSGPLFDLVRWYIKQSARYLGWSQREWQNYAFLLSTLMRMRDPLESQATCLMNEGALYFGDNMDHVLQTEQFSLSTQLVNEIQSWYIINDKSLLFQTWILRSQLSNPKFNIINWYNKTVEQSLQNLCNELLTGVDETAVFDWLYQVPTGPEKSAVLEMVADLTRHCPNAQFEEVGSQAVTIELNGQQIPSGTYPALEQNAAITKDYKRMLPQPVVVTVLVNQQPARALIDSGLLADFMSSTLANQLKVPLSKLAKPLPIQLAVQGSHSNISFGT
ncbi:hypothetical protein SERLA73DRAFT_76992 [Serpula lacrymans var. lacrymans S7.3]|uniref:Uncharacterized protein n=2 Tax=Serpula lacrymans var. lacrymans TaxID=341189 RepID=F8Q8S4_SERL3|nr:uncharacterized protein SERLADRAFT_441812 [Serpula lacrymans var. lacrymans S7.9]EGN94979.1 hypothetical protein SERLA73DRAFT_76992 [Serpula lacrymans var. lacrymans S7.3]EGO20470.1 hypothetical protein SERLADRAFT_441812 [Serpula lacrymans var. lacrymans S7.9]